MCVVDSLWLPQASARSVRRLSASAAGGCGAPECGTGICAGTSSAVGSGSKLGAAASAYPKRVAKNMSAAAAGATRPATAPAAAATLPSPSSIFNSSSPSAQASLAHISSLLNSREPGKTLPAALYLDESVYAAELALLWNRGWLFAGYTNQLPKAGNYFTYEIGDESLIIIRSEEGTNGGGGSEGKIQAFHNSCRHRGSRIVTATQETQHTHRLVCPYHQWSYARDGSLVHARDMGAGFNKEDNALHEVHLEEVEGLIFICLTPKAQKPMWDFAPARALMSKQLKPHSLARGSKIAYSANYTINSNWKLVYENNRECYHCAGSHPEYVKSNYDLHLTYNQKPDGTYERALDPTYPAKEKVLAYIESKSKDWESMGFACSPDSSFPGDGWYRASRMPLKEGWVTESMDGQPVSSIMGNLPQRDMGSFRIHTLPNVRHEESQHYAKGVHEKASA